MTQPSKILGIICLVLTIGLILAVYQNSRYKSEIANLKATIPVVISKSVSVCDEVLKSIPLTKAERYTGKIAEVDFTSWPEAYIYRTTIRDQVAKGPDFFGHYAVTMWGCGTECFGFAIIDVVNGKIVEYQPFWTQISAGLDYSIDSNLLVRDSKKIFKNSQNLPKTVQEIVAKDFEAHKARTFHKLRESESGARLILLCTENIYDGVF